MAVDRTIGSHGLEQGGPNLGNDYSRDITRERQANDTTKVVIPKDKNLTDKEDQEKREQNSRVNP